MLSTQSSPRHLFGGRRSNNYRKKSVAPEVRAAKDGQVVMCSRVKEPKVAIFPSDFTTPVLISSSVQNVTDAIVDGTAFHVPGKTVTGEYFCITVKEDMSRQLEKTEALGEALKMEMFKSVRDKTWNVVEPIYYVAVVQPDNDEYVYVYDLEGIEYYMASYRDGQFTFRRAILGPGLLHELKEVLQ